MVGTVAYSAPLLDGLDDPRPTNFINSAPLGQACQDKLRAFQQIVLDRRAAMEALMLAGGTYNFLGVDAALDYGNVDCEWGFYQYAYATDCKDIPVAADPDDYVFAWLQYVGSAYSDQDITDFQAYYWQSATELGGSESPDQYLTGLTVPHESWTPGLFITPGKNVTAVYDPTVLADIAAWLATPAADHLIMVYGQNDPYAQAPMIPSGPDTLVVVGPGENHLVEIDTLTPADAQAVKDKLSAWTGMSVMSAKAKKPEKRPVPFLGRGHHLMRERPTRQLQQGAN